MTFDLRKIDSNLSSSLVVAGLRCCVYPDKVFRREQLLRVELCFREIVCQESISAGLSDDQRRACECMRSAIQYLRDLNELHFSFKHYSPPVCPSVDVGRPRFHIPRQQLQYLIEHQFTVPQMAGMLGVSTRTVEKRMSEFGLSIRQQYASLTDGELEGIVREILQQYPTCGNQQLQGYLVSRGVCVQRDHLRDVH